MPRPSSSDYCRSRQRPVGGRGHRHRRPRHDCATLAPEFERLLAIGVARSIAATEQAGICDDDRSGNDRHGDHRRQARPDEPSSPRRPTTRCRADSPISPRWAKRWTMPRGRVPWAQFPRCARQLGSPYPVRRTREDALATAYRLIAAGVKPEDRIALIAETGAGIRRAVLRRHLCRRLAGAAAAADQLRRRAICLYRPASVQLDSCDPLMLIYPARTRRDGGRSGAAWPASRGSTGTSSPTRDAPVADAARGDSRTTSPICNIPAARRASRTASRSPTTRCSTISPRIATAWKSSDGDRCVSWLPWYHDMGLVGCFLSLVANQVSTDYLKTEDFARRPLAWLDLISRNPGTTLSYSPTFGYDICARRMSSQTKASRPLRPVALARRRQRRRHDPPRRDAELRRRLRRCRVQGERVPAELWPGRSDAGGLDHAAGRRHPSSNWSRKPSCRAARRGDDRPAALPRDRQLRQAGARHEGRNPRGGRHAAARARDRQGLVQRAVGDGRLFPRSTKRPPPAWPTAGSTPATWAIMSRRLYLHRRPRQGHDHHQRQQPLAAGHRMGGRAAARLQGGRHRRLRDHHAGRRGNPRRAGPVPHLRR